SISEDVVAVHLSQLSGPDRDEQQRWLRKQWRDDVEASAIAAGLLPPRLVVLNAQYRAMHQPILKLIRELQGKFSRRRIAVLIPEVVKRRWYQLRRRRDRRPTPRS